MPNQFYNSSGKTVSLGDTLGSPGGEGIVREVRDHAAFVAKLYHTPPSAEKRAKLGAMIQLKTERLLKLTAWPIDTLFNKPGGQLVGFMMPRALGYKDVHKLYGVKSRKSEYPEARWPFLIQAASNVARAFRVVHQHGHVIGDVNHGGVLIANNATAMLVDCDSFQVTANGHKFLCEVGIATHTPPELQGHSFQGIVRTVNHDAFGLAVIIFQLLFLGRHPFSGRYVRGDMPIEQAIKENRFAYGADAGTRMMRQPPGTLPLEAVSESLQNLFRRAFLEGGLRPNAEAWITPLDDLSKNLRQCQQNTGHSFLKSLPKCPWCDIEAESGTPVFYPIFIGGAVGIGGFNIGAVWSLISRVPAPGSIPTLPNKNAISVTPSSKVKPLKRRRLVRSAIALTGLVGICTLLLALPIGGGLTAILIIVIGILTISVIKGGQSELVKELSNAKDEAARRWKEVEERWRLAGGNVDFQLKKSELEKKKLEYESLPRVLQSRLELLKRQIRERQLEKFLDGFRIDRASISGIGHARKITLRSYGVETAADVNMHAVLNVPGFGPTYTSKLVAWRHALEQRFRFDPTRGVDPADKQAVHQEFAAQRARLEREIQTGLTELRQVSYRLRTSRELMERHIEEAIHNLAQAERDFAEGVGTPKRLIPVFAIAGFALVLILPIKGDFQKSLNTKTSISRPQPSASTSPRPSPSVEDLETKAVAAYENGLNYTKSGRFQESVVAYREAITFKPDYQEAYHELGYALYRLRKYDEAVAASKQAVLLKATDADGYRNLGLSYEALERWPDAQSAYKGALRIEPNHAGTYVNLGRSYSKAGNADEAIAAYKDAVRLKPKLANAHYELGLLSADNGDFDAAYAEYEILVSLNETLAEKLYARLSQD